MIYDSIELPISAANILLPIIIELLNTQNFVTTQVHQWDWQRFDARLDTCSKCS